MHPTVSRRSGHADLRWLHRSRIGLSQQEREPPTSARTSTPPFRSTIRPTRTSRSFARARARAASRCSRRDPQTDAWRAEGYLETDFLSAGTSSNSAESNSYTLRIRHFYGVLRNTEANWYLLAGQDWSYATLSTTGTMQPRTEQVPLTIDAQYVVGFNWTRNAQLRFVKLFGDSASLGISFESPQARLHRLHARHHGRSTTPAAAC